MGTWQHVAVADSPTPAVFVELKDGSSVFPLYLYPASDQSGTALCKPNLANKITTSLAGRLRAEFNAGGHGKKETTFGPEDVFDYIYAVLHSPTYRKRYAEFLKSDFPRIPLTSNRDLFWALCAKGEELVALHLMKKFGPLAVGFPVKGDGKVEKVRYTEPDKKTPGRVWINKTQYFESVPPEIWEFHIGGYQVCEKWLKDRKGRTLNYEDIRNYERIVASLSETIHLMGEIDAAIEAHGGWPIR